MLPTHRQNHPALPHFPLRSTRLTSFAPFPTPFGDFSRTFQPTSCSTNHAQTLVTTPRNKQPSSSISPLSFRNPKSPIRNPQSAIPNPHLNGSLHPRLWYTFPHDRTTGTDHLRFRYRRQ